MEPLYTQLQSYTRKAVQNTGRLISVANFCRLTRQFQIFRLRQILFPQNDTPGSRRSQRFYTPEKILFAKLSGYRILSLHLLGFMFDAPKDKFKFHYDILSFFELQLRFVPKDDDL